MSKRLFLTVAIALFAMQGFDIVMFVIFNPIVTSTELNPIANMTAYTMGTWGYVVARVVFLAATIPIIPIGLKKESLRWLVGPPFGCYLLATISWLFVLG